MEETIRSLVAFGLVLLLVLARFDAARFGISDEGGSGDRLASAASDVSTGAVRRLGAWYVLVAVLVVAAAAAHPADAGDLGLGLGGLAATLVFGIAYGVVGAVGAIALATLDGRRLQPPEELTTSLDLVAAAGTAVADEVVFRGLLLGLMLLAGIDPTFAILAQALLYALATGAATRSPDRPVGGELPRVVLVLAIGLVGGWLAVVTGGLGAAIVGHAAVRVTLALAADPAPEPTLRTAPEGR